MTVKELEFDTEHFIEAHTALVDVIVAIVTAIERAEGGFFGNVYRRTDRCSRVLLGNNKQERTADSGGAVYRPRPRKAEQRPRGDRLQQFNPGASELYE